MQMNSAQLARNGNVVTRWTLLAAATVVAGFLMFFYVQLLNDSVTRGAHWRYSQATLQSSTSVTPSANVRLVGSSR